MSQQHSTEEINARMQKILDGFREVLADNGLSGVEVFHIELRETANMETLFASDSGCTWNYICKPTPHGWKCQWECV